MQKNGVIEAQRGCFHLPWVVQHFAHGCKHCELKTDEECMLVWGAWKRSQVTRLQLQGSTVSSPLWVCRWGLSLFCSHRIRFVKRCRSCLAKETLHFLLLSHVVTRFYLLLGCSRCRDTSDSSTCAVLQISSRKGWNIALISVFPGSYKVMRTTLGTPHSPSRVVTFLSASNDTITLAEVGGFIPKSAHHTEMQSWSSCMCILLFYWWI